MKSIVAAALIAIVLGDCMHAHAQSFHPIVIPSVPFHLHSPVASVLDVSPDGSRVAGAVIQNGVEFDCSGLCTVPFIWTAAGTTEIQSLLEPIPLFRTIFRTVTSTAGEVVGVTTEAALTNGSGEGRFEPVLFVAGDQRLLRDVSQESLDFFGTAISDNARVIAGNLRDREWRWQPVRWTAETGISVIDVSEPNARSTGISGNGQVVVGTSGRNLHDLL